MSEAKRSAHETARHIPAALDLPRVQEHQILPQLRLRMVPVHRVETADLARGILERLVVQPPLDSRLVLIWTKRRHAGTATMNASQQRKGMATTSLVLGILSVPCLSILAGFECQLPAAL